MKRTFAFIVLLIPAIALGNDSWRLVRTVGKVHMVMIDKSQEKNQDIYRLAISKLCSGKEYCKVLFWTNESMVPSSMPMTDAQAKALKADWTYNGKTGHSQLIWSCKIVNDPNQCFSN